MAKLKEKSIESGTPESEELVRKQREKRQFELKQQRAMAKQIELKKSTKLLSLERDINDIRTRLPTAASVSATASSVGVSSTPQFVRPPEVRVAETNAALSAFLAPGYDPLPSSTAELRRSYNADLVEANAAATTVPLVGTKAATFSRAATAVMNPVLPSVPLAAAATGSVPAVASPTVSVAATVSEDEYDFTFEATPAAATPAVLTDPHLSTVVHLSQATGAAGLTVTIPVLSDSSSEPVLSANSVLGGSSSSPTLSSTCTCLLVAI